MPVIDTYDSVGLTYSMDDFDTSFRMNVCQTWRMYRSHLSCWYLLYRYVYKFYIRTNVHIYNKLLIQHGVAFTSSCSKVQRSRSNEWIHCTELFAQHINCEQTNLNLTPNIKIIFLLFITCWKFCGKYAEKYAQCII